MVYQGLVRVRVRPYNLGVSRTLSPRPPLSCWARFAAWLGFLAVLSALVAPASMLAEEVRTGKLGGLCSLTTTPAGKSDAGNSQAPQPGSHCDACTAMDFVLPVLPVSAIPCFPGDRVATIAVPADVAASIPGLPFSRGPPAL